MALIYDVHFNSGTRVLSLLDKAGNVISSCEVPSKELVDDIKKPLTFRATQEGSTVRLFPGEGSPSGTFQTSRDGGKTWVDYTLNTTIALNTGDEVSFRAKSDRTSIQSMNYYFKFTMSGKIEAWHNVMSLYRTNDFATYDTAIFHAFYRLFYGCTSLTKAPALPATTLNNGCYYSMFEGCTSLAEAPELPATTLDNDCYGSMFNGCTSLTKSPELPATTLYNGCYQYMFLGCTSLTKAPALPATTLAQYCYGSMFNRCTSLAEAPELPATTLDNGCYQYMFLGCTSLTKAPELPSTTLATNCYKYMFSGCTSLTKAPVLPATTLTPNCYYYMFRDCTSLVNAPELPATTLANDCYVHMFGGCTSLVNAPALPATTLTPNCYYYMFRDCTSLVNAPELPATTLADSCYLRMFIGCTSLEKAPELPATTLAKDCYDLMFHGCSNLNEVRCNMPSKYSSSDVSNYTSSWLQFAASKGTFYTNADANWSSGDSGIPTGWTRRDINLINALTLTATADNSSVKLTKNGTLDNTFEVDTGNGWTAYEFDTVIPLNAGQSCKWRCSAHPTTQLYDKVYVQFVMTGGIAASGNVSSMLSSSFESITSSLGDYNAAFHRLFMDCTALTQAPPLPAMTVGADCYDGMFKNCTGLTQVPELPANILANDCYYEMFSGCTSLVQAPVLPVTKLLRSCYAHMFSGCTSLVQAPALPATRLEKYCYWGMFSGCSKLKEVRISATTTATDALKEWLKGVSATGDFYCDPNATIFPTDSISGIPKNWTRHALADYPATP